MLVFSLIKAKINAKIKILFEKETRIENMMVNRKKKEKVRKSSHSRFGFTRVWRRIQKDVGNNKKRRN